MRPVSEESRQIGDRLRAARKARGLTLKDVDERTHGEFKANVLGSYERGQRRISAERLRRLAALYAVSPQQLVPPQGKPLEAQQRTVNGRPSRTQRIDVLMALFDTVSSGAAQDVALASARWLRDRHPEIFATLARPAEGIPPRCCT